MVETVDLATRDEPGAGSRLDVRRIAVHLVRRGLAARHVAVTPFVLTLVFLASAMLVLAPVFGTSWQTLPGDIGDMTLVNYVLEHGHLYVSGGVAAFWNAPFFFPHPNVLVLSENQIGAVPFYSLFRLLGLDPETSLQGWIATGFLLNYVAAALVFRRLGLPLHLAALGAFLFAFSVPQMLHLHHIQLTYRFPMPLAWYAGYRYLAVGRTRHLALCGLFTCWQFYITPYFGYFLALALLVTAAAYLFGHGEALVARWRSVSGWTWVAQAAITVACAVLLLPVLVPYTAASIPGNPTSEVLGMLPRPQSYLLGSRDDYLAKLFAAEWRVDAVYPWEHLIFPGIVTLLLVPTAWGLLLVPGARARMPLAVRLAAVTLLVLFVLTLTFREVSLYRILLDLVPAVGAFRVVTRISLMFGFFAALCVCWLLSFAYASIRPLRPLPVQIALAALLWVVTSWEAGVNGVTVSKAAVQARVARIVSDVQATAQPDSVLITLHTNPDEPWYATQTTSMLAAQALGIGTMNGYSRAVPPGFSAQPAQCADVVSMARAYEAYVPGFRFEAVRHRLLVSPVRLACQPTWSRLLHPPPVDVSSAIEYRASFDIQCLNCPTLVNETVQLVVGVQNASARAWPLLPLGLSGRIVRADTDDAVTGFESRVYLGQVLESGGTAPLVLALKGPAEPGDYLLETDLVHENVAWFSQAGPTIKGRFPLRVLPPPAPRARLITPERIW